jgi:hypothetical protein
MLAASGGPIGEVVATLADDEARHDVAFDRGQLKSSLVQLQRRGAIAAFAV